ncbi:MAG: hypothetical protein E7097_05650 [Bacteroides sp.]|nr:hypothetical protein [Bacteroides sp.]
MMNKSHQWLAEQKIYRYRRKRPARLIRRYGVQITGKLTHKVLLPFAVNHFMNNLGFAKSLKNKITVPKDFSFYTNFNACINFFRELISTFVNKENDVTIDFSQCRNVSVSTLTLIDVLYKEFLLGQIRHKRINENHYIRRLKIIPSYHSFEVKKYLHSLRFYEYDDFKDGDGEVLPFELIKGKKRNSYQENTKGKAVAQIVEFINNSLQPVNKSLTSDGLNIIESLVSEILNNAEDHSHNNCEWYANGIAFHETIKNEDVVELNLVIMNFGNTMYQGFEGTKVLNKDNYSKVDNKYNQHRLLFKGHNRFERESLFMLYMLNEGISRLKYEDDSRGNGTMQFLDAFSQIGSFGNKNPDFIPRLNIISGHTVLSCDNKVAPYAEGKHLKLSLNKEKDLTLLPDTEYLNYYNEFFPGTIIECRIFLNEKFFDEILNNNHNE